MTWVRVDARAAVVLIAGGMLLGVCLASAFAVGWVTVLRAEQTQCR
jgi:predicted outer membrane lipoprotein